MEEGGVGWEGEKEWEGACASLPQIHSVRKDGGKKIPFSKNCEQTVQSAQVTERRASARLWRISLNTLKRERESEAMNVAAGHTGQCSRYRFKTCHKTVHTNGRNVWTWGEQLCALESTRVTTCRKCRVLRSSSGEGKGLRRGGEWPIVYCLPELVLKSS